MTPLEECLEHADELADEFVATWARFKSAGHSPDADFEAVYEKARLYRIAKSVADDRREYSRLSEAEAAEETATREAFCRARKDFLEKQARS